MPVPLNSAYNSNIHSVLSNLNNQLAEQRHYESTAIDLLSPELNPTVYEVCAAQLIFFIPHIDRRISKIPRIQVFLFQI